MDSVVFGIDRRVTTDRDLLAALAAVATAFEPNPKDLVAVLGDRSGDIMWFTFRATAWARDVAMPVTFFEDTLRKAGLTFVCVKRDELVPSDVVVSAIHDDQVVLEVRSDGITNAITAGAADEEFDRAGDAESFALAAIAWATRVPWGTFGDDSPRVALRRDRAVVRVLDIELGGAPLPPVVVTRASEDPFVRFCELATELFSVRRRTGTTLPPPVTEQPAAEPAAESASKTKGRRGARAASNPDAGAAKKPRRKRR
jgi:hypothetical protein